MDYVRESLTVDDRRIIVVGSSAAGKSTLARQLAQQLKYPHVELDELHWGPNWTPREDFQLRVAAAVTGESWIIEGGYSVIRPILWPRATTVIWLDYAFPVVLWRAVRRALRRSWTREEMWAGNRESWIRLFTPSESIVWFMIKTFHRKRRAFSELRNANTYPQLRWIHLHNPSQARRLLSHAASDVVGAGSAAILDQE